MLSKITLIDFLSKNSSHLNFNKSFIQAIPAEYDIHNFIGHQSHYLLLETSEIPSKAIRNENFNWAIRIILIFSKLLFNSKKNLTILAFENYIFPSLALLFFPFFLRKHFTMVVHNNVPALMKRGIKTIPFAVFVKLFKPQLICLTKKIKDEMDKLGYNKNTTWIPHMNYNHINKQSFKGTPVPFPSNKINIVLLGRQSKLFVDHTLLKINDQNLQNLQFHVFHNEIKRVNTPNIQFHKKRPSQEEYQSILQFADYCFFPDLNVDFRPSGILLDCISATCPIIAPRSGHFKEFENEKIGWFYHEETLTSVLDNLNISQTKRNQFLRENFIQSAANTSIELFSKNLKTIYSRF